MKKETYKEAESLQREIDRLTVENEELENVSEQLNDLALIKEDGKTKELPVHIQGVKLKSIGTIHALGELVFSPMELNCMISDRVATNEARIDELTDKFNAL